MTEHCIIKADFSATRIVAGRKCLQMIFEVPIEQADDVMAKLGGFPQPDSNRWCAIALLDLKAEGQAEQREAAPKKSWSEIPRSQQAAILCSDADFQRYFVTRDAEDCAHKLRQHFHIPTRRELDKPERHAGWDEFVALYHMHRDRLK